MFSIRMLFVCLLLVFHGFCLHAALAQETAVAAPGEHGLDAIVVTATRTPEPEKDVPQVIEVITRKEIEDTPGHDLTEVLKKNSTIDVIQYPGALSGIGIRGFRPEFSGITKHSLLLIDGRPAGATNLSTITLGNIDRIEVLKGPASSLYGAEAMGGVVNVITIKSTGRIRGQIYGQAGSFNTWNGGTHLGGKLLPMLDFDLTASTLNRNTDMELGNGHGSRPGTTYNIGYGSLRIGSRFLEGWRADLEGDWYYGNDIETPGAEFYFDRQQSQKDLDRYGGDFRLEGTWGKNKSLFVLYGSKESSDSYKKYEYDPETQGYVPSDPHHSYFGKIKWWGAQAQDMYQLFDVHNITIGLDYEKIYRDSKSYNEDGSRKAPWSPNCERENWAFFTETMWRFFDESLVITAGFRYDYFDLETKTTPYKTDFSPGSESFDTLSPRAGLRYNWNDLFSLHTTIGKAFVPPTADQMAGYSERWVGDTVMVTKGNPHLDPETSWTWDGGASLEHKGLGVLADVTYFITEVDDKISRVTKGNTTTFSNSSDAEMSGLEFKAHWDAGRFLDLERTIEFYVDGTRLFYSREKLQGQGWRDIHNVAHWKLNYGVRYDDGLVDGAMMARYVGKRKDYDWYAPGYPIIEYPAFTVVDMNLGLTLLRHHHLNFKLANIFDEYYYEKPEFPLPGRHWLFEYRFTF